MDSSSEAGTPLPMRGRAGGSSLADIGAPSLARPACFRGDLNESPAPQHESVETWEPGEPEVASGGPPDAPVPLAPLRQRSGWCTLVRITPAILFTMAYAVLEHRYYARGGRDALNSLSNGLVLLPLGFIGSVVVGVLSAGWAVRDRPPHRSAALVWTGKFILVILLNACRMFGGCLTVARLRSP